MFYNPKPSIINNNLDIEKNNFENEGKSIIINS